MAETKYLDYEGLKHLLSLLKAEGITYPAYPFIKVTFENDHLLFSSKERASFGVDALYLPQESASFGIDAIYFANPEGNV